MIDAKNNYYFKRQAAEARDATQDDEGRYDTGVIVKNPKPAAEVPVLEPVESAPVVSAPVATSQLDTVKIDDMELHF